MVSDFHKKEDKFRLEGALGYALRIAKKIEEKASIEEINAMVQTDFGSMSAALTRHFNEELMMAGFETGLFKESDSEKN